MAIDFPNSPSSGDTYTVNGKTWIWDGSVWAAYGNYLDPAVLKVDTVNGRVGINNTNPTVALDVTGSAAVSGDMTVDGNFTVSGTTTTINTTDLNVQDNIITLNYGVTGTPTLDAGIEVERGDLTNTSLTWDESATSWVVGSTAYVDTTNGRVGIGVASPTVALDVTGSAKISNDFSVDGTTLHVDSATSNVGINTASPTYGLDVQRSARFTGTITAEGGIDGLTLASGIAGSNFNITGVNQMEIADPGEGIIWKGGASGDYSMYLIDDASDKILSVGGVTNSRVRIVASSGNSEIELDYQNGGSQRWAMYANSTDNSLNWYTSAGAATRMTLDTAGQLSIAELSASTRVNTNSIRNTNGNWLALEGGDSWNLDANATGEYVWLAAEGGIVIVSSDANSTTWASRNQIRLTPTGGIDNALLVTGQVQATSVRINSGPLLSDPSTANELRVTTAYGYIDIGPKNASYCHIYTDRNAFYFDKQTQHAGGIFMRGTLDMDSQIIDMTHSGAYISFGDVSAVNMQWGAGGDIRWNPTYNYIQVNQGSSQRMVWACDNGYNYAQRFYQPGGGSTYNWSDARLKTDVTDYSGGLSLLQQLRPVEYTWDCDQIPANGQREIGLIAQEVETIYPKWVGRYSEEPHTRTSDGAEIADVKALGFGNDFNVIVIAAIKELAARIEALEAG